MDRDEFVLAMERLRRNNGAQYAENTVTAYANALYWNNINPGGGRGKLWQLCCDHLQLANTSLCYGQLTREQLQALDGFIQSDSKARTLDVRHGHRTVSAAIRMLIRFL